MQRQSFPSDSITIRTQFYGSGFKSYCSCGKYESPQRGFAGNSEACATQHAKRKHPDATVHYTYPDG